MTRRHAVAITAILTIALIATAVLLYGKSGKLISVTIPDIWPGYYTVTRVVDGDTIVIDMNGTSEKIRMIGVDTPETKDPDEPVQCYGQEASSFTTRTLLGKSVRLTTDKSSDNRDRYGRLLRYVYTQDNELFEEMLISQGYGFAYTSFPFGKMSEFSKLQTQAQTAKVGLWSTCTPAQDNNGKWTSNDL